jgi:hypothetical protein
MVHIFSNQKFQIWVVLEGLSLEDVGIFYGQLVYFTAVWSITPIDICYILW